MDLQDFEMCEHHDQQSATRAGAPFFNIDFSVKSIFC
jgi:hypothetical protein